MFGLSTLRLYIFGGMCAAIVLLGAGDLVLGSWWWSARHDLKTMTTDRNAQATAVKVGQGIVAAQQKTMDADDAKAWATIKSQQASVLQLASQAQASADDRETLLQQIKDQAHAHSAIVVSSVPVPVGFDPVVLAGMRCLRGVQLGHALSSPECRIQAADGTGGPGSAGDPAGAGAPRPNAEQQADFLAFAWRLRDWGASCYADKRAIAASQAAAQ